MLCYVMLCYVIAEEKSLFSRYERKLTADADKWQHVGPRPASCTGPGQHCRKFSS